MEVENFKARCIKTAGIIALAGNAVLALLKIGAACRTKSMALLGDGLDSSSDVLIAIVTLIIGNLIQKPEDKTHPWGHGRTETVATMALSFIIFFAGAQLTLQAVEKLISGTQLSQVSMLPIIVSLFSIAGKTMLALVQYRYGRMADSEILKANAANMKNDIILSSGVLVGLSASHILKCPVLDPVIAILVGLWVVKNSVELFLHINMELTDGNTDNSLYEKLFKAASSVQGISNPHKARIRKIASMLDIDLDIEVPPEMTVYDAHELSEELEDAIRKELPEVYDVVIHIEPFESDTHQKQEKFGISPKSLMEGKSEGK